MIHIHIAVQHKSNLISACVLQVKAKITSCVQYLNGCLLHLCTLQTNHKHVNPQTLHLFWMNILMKINLNNIYLMKLCILSLYISVDPWSDCHTEQLLMCSCMQYLILYCLVWRMNLALRVSESFIANKSPLCSSHLSSQLFGR